MGSRRQAGFVLLLIVLAMIAVGGVLFLGIIANTVTSAQKAQADAIAGNDVLSAAKSILIGYATQATDGGDGRRLGNLMTPDSNASASVSVAGLYDGKSDGDLCLQTPTNGFKGLTSSAGLGKQRCLGKFPWQQFGLNLGSVDAHDPAGKVPWLAISANLNTWDQCILILNSDLLNWTYPGTYSCGVKGSLPYPWMTVYDEKGAVLSNRVAAVLIMPGPPISTGARTQSRSAVNPGSAPDYLDVISVPLGCTSSCTATFDNADLSNKFIAIPAGTRYPLNAEDTSKAGQSLTFNDQVIYITIDELMPYIERRVLSEMKAKLIDFKSASKTNQYPWMAPFAQPNVIAAFNSAAGTTFGHFPFIPGTETGTTAVAQATDFDWSITGATIAKKCIANGTSYLNTREYIPAFYGAGSTPVGSSTCTWQAGSPNAVTCDYTNSTASSTTIAAYKRYTSSACTTASTSATRVIKVSKLIVAVDAVCNSTPTITYAGATASDFSRWNWQCNSVNGLGVHKFQIEVTYGIYTSGGTLIGSDVATIDANSRQAFVNRMRYQPVMPYWFYQNEWYKSAFAAIAPAKAPGTVTPCGSAALLTSDSNTSIDAMVMLAGRRLNDTNPLNADAGSALTDYLESPNSTAGINCVLSKPGATVTTTSNDQTLIVAP